MLKIMTLVCSVMGLYLTSMAHGVTSNNNFDSPAEIDRKIERLKAELQRSGVEEIKEDVEGQGAMIANWPRYGQELEDIRGIQEQQNAIRKQIQELEQYKSRLITESQQ